MAVSASERRFILDNLTRLAEADIRAMWRLAEVQSDVEFAAYVIDAFPEVIGPYYELASQASATFFEEEFPAITQAPVIADSLPDDKLRNAARWALSADGDQAISRMAGTTQRAIYDGDRNTTTQNAGRAGMSYVRVARPNACAFCRLLASRTADGETYSAAGVIQKIDPETNKPFEDGRLTTVVYGRRRSGSKQKVGKEYHDFCHCVAKAIPRGVDPMEYLQRSEPEAAELASRWDAEYLDARGKAKSEDPRAILSEWRKRPGVEDYVPKPATAPFDRSVLDNATSVEQVGQYINGKHGINVDALIDSPMAQGIPIETSIARGVDVLSAAKAAKPFYLDPRTAREFGQSIDDVFTDLPFLELDEFKADFYPSGNPLSSVAHAGQRVGPERGNGASRLVINQMADAEGEAPGSAYERYRRGISADSFDNRYKAEAIKRPAYSVGIHEVGHVVHFNGGDPTQVTKDCFLALRQEIFNTPGAKALREQILRDKPGAFERLAGNRLELMPEYEEFERQWFRDNLVSAYSFKDGDRSTGIPDRYEMLAEAFADVRLRGDNAEKASKIVHDVMVEAARKNKTKK